LSFACISVGRSPTRDALPEEIEEAIPIIVERALFIETFCSCQNFENTPTHLPCSQKKAKDFRAELYKISPGLKRTVLQVHTQKNNRIRSREQETDGGGGTK
jgi:hypothetical protein